MGFLLAEEYNITKQKITELENSISNIKNTTSTGMILFEKRTKCGGLTTDIEAKINTLNKEYSDLTGKFSIGGIFYSPTKDACLWVRLTRTYAPDGSPLERRALYQYGDDFGATKPIIGCEQILGEKQGTNACEKYDSALKKFKGEEHENVLNP